MKTQRLPRSAPARVLAVGAFLKNTACLLDGDTVHWSAPHGDLATPAACLALDASVQTLLRQAGGRVDAVAHDLHPDFESTHLALALAERLGVPAVAVQHHHAHIAVVQAEQGTAEGAVPVVGLALDGVGLGLDGLAWGGELLEVSHARWRRLGHLTPLALPGADVAAREPWRMAAAALSAAGREDEIVPRLAAAVGRSLATGVRDMLRRGLNCPHSTSAGRWFDALAGLAGLSVRQAAEAEAAIALERAAAQWLADHDAAALNADLDAAMAAHGLDLLPLLRQCLADIDAGHVPLAAARFHLGLASGLAHAAAAVARRIGSNTVVLGGGCFYNRVLTQAVVTRLQARDLRVQQPGAMAGPGDAGLALGQAWVAAHSVSASTVLPKAATPAARGQEELACA